MISYQHMENCLMQIHYYFRDSVLGGECASTNWRYLVHSSWIRTAAVYLNLRVYEIGNLRKCQRRINTRCNIFIDGYFSHAMMILNWSARMFCQLLMLQQNWEINKQYSTKKIDDNKKFFIIPDGVVMEFQKLIDIRNKFVFHQ